MRQLSVSLVILLLFSFSVFAQQDSLPEQTQSWNELQLILPLKYGKDRKGKTIDKITASFSGIARIGRKDFLDNRIGSTIDYRVNRYLSVFGGVLYRQDEITKNQPRNETRLTTGATLSATWRGFTFRDRNMFEHRFRNNRADTNLYRQRIQISHPIKYKEKEIFAPFISEEGYFDLQTKEWVQNEFYAGITRRLTPKISLDIAYLRSDTRPVNVNGLSLNLRIRLR